MMRIGNKEQKRIGIKTVIVTQIFFMLPLQQEKKVNRILSLDDNEGIKITDS